MYDSSGEPFVHPDNNGTSRFRVSGSEFDDESKTLDEDVRKRSARKRSLTTFLESYFPSILHNGFVLGPVVVHPQFFQKMPSFLLESPEQTRCRLAWRLMVSRRNATPFLPDAW